MCLWRSWSFVPPVVSVVLVVAPHARVEVLVVPAVRVEEGVAHDALQPEAGLLRHPAGGLVGDGVAEGEAVQAELVQPQSVSRRAASTAMPAPRPAGSTQ